MNKQLFDAKDLIYGVKFVSEGKHARELSKKSQNCRFQAV